MVMGARVTSPNCSKSSVFGPAKVGSSMYGTAASFSGFHLKLTVCFFFSPQLHVSTSAVLSSDIYARSKKSTGPSVYFWSWPCPYESSSTPLTFVMKDFDEMGGSAVCNIEFLCTFEAKTPLSQP